MKEQTKQYTTFGCAHWVIQPRQWSLLKAHIVALDEPDDPENRIARVLEIVMDF